MKGFFMTDKMTPKKRGLYDKYEVRKIRGETDPGAQYFVLRIDTDPSAQFALWAYIRDMRRRDEAFANELQTWLFDVVPDFVPPAWLLPDD
jgi:hypothetical protein